MHRIDLQLTLREDLVVDERPATEGGHAGLDYLPGYLLLGAAAARLYPRLSRADAYRLFHSGEVRFGDGLPLVAGQPVWPMPLCWHERKGDSATVSGWLQADKLRNFQFGRFTEPAAQPQQLRAGYVRADGWRHSVNQSFRMKTAIDPTTGRIAEAQLFGYESIDAGQSFVSRIQAAATLPAPLWTLLVEALTAAPELLLGRSRGAEYGRVEVRAWHDGFPAREPEALADAASLTLWCLSDLALLDEWGQPTLAPTPAVLGLQRGRIDWERSFLRFRRYAVWNAHRDGYDLERQVIQRGSVIAITGLESPLTPAEKAHLLAGVGLHREAGLGWLCLNPVLLGDAQPRFSPRVPLPSPPVAARPDDPLIAWLEASRAAGDSRDRLAARVREQRTQLRNIYQAARAFSGIPPDQPCGPSTAQWGSVYEYLRQADSSDTQENLAAIERDLFEGPNALCKGQAEGWQDSFGDTQGLRNFRDWFRASVPALASVAALRLFTREAMRVAQGEKGRSHRQEEPQ